VNTSSPGIAGLRRSYLAETTARLILYPWAKKTLDIVQMHRLIITMDYSGDQVNGIFENHEMDVFPQNSQLKKYRLN
jgi:hypothetical protein